MSAVGLTPFERLRQGVAVHPLRVMSAEELYDLVRKAMNDRSLHHPGRCRRAAAAVQTEAPSCPAEGRYSRCNLRCDMSYWHAHGNAVGHLMARLARRVGKDPNLYMATGVLSTIDYLAHPHDLGEQPDDSCHPGPLVRRLIELDAPRSMLLAIVEAPAHTTLKPSGLLGHALRVCDAMACCLEAERNFPLPDGAGELHEVFAERDSMRLVPHGDLDLVEREHIRRHTRESCLALALAVRTKDNKRAEQRASRTEVRQGLAEALAERQARRRRRPGQDRARAAEGGEAIGPV